MIAEAPRRIGEWLTLGLDDPPPQAYLKPARTFDQRSGSDWYGA